MTTPPRQGVGPGATTSPGARPTPCARTQPFRATTGWRSQPATGRNGPPGPPVLAVSATHVARRQPARRGVFGLGVRAVRRNRIRAMVPDTVGSTVPSAR